MFKIDTPHATVSEPVASPAGTPGYFVDTGVASTTTEFSADWCNAVQGELCAMAVGLGATMTKGDNDQIWTLLQPRLYTACTWTDKIQVGADGIGGFTTLIDNEGGEGFPLYGLLATDRAYLEEGLYIGTPGSSSQVVDSNLDCDFRNISLSSGAVDGVKLVAFTGRVATIGDVYAEGDIKVGCSDLLGADPTITLDGSTGQVSASGGLVLPTGGTAPICGTDYYTPTLTAGSQYTVSVSTSAVGSSSLVFPVIAGFVGAGQPVVTSTDIVAGTSITIYVKNIHTSENVTNIRLNWMLINPA